MFSVSGYMLENYFTQRRRKKQVTIVGLISKDSDMESEMVSEYDQEIPQSQTADNPMALRGRAAQPSRDTRRTN